MAAALFGKKEPGDVDAAETSTGDHTSELEQLTSHLETLGELLAQANRQIEAYLVRRESQSGAGGAGERTTEALGQQIAALAKKLDQPAFQEKLDQVVAGVKALCEASVPGSAGEGVSGASILEAVQKLQARLDGGLERLADLLAPQEPTDEHAGPVAGSAHWEWALLGPDLAQRPELARERGQFLRGVLEGDAGACALAGQLLVFQSAPAERLPQLLKDIGEAFYRFRPKTTPGTDPLEQALVQWLRRSCEAAGISNTISLVHPGERFDAARHTAASRGVEITEVHGWIVLRDNGKVYTKAAVAVE